jgi:hypothetical protein
MAKPIGKESSDLLPTRRQLLLLGALALGEFGASSPALKRWSWASHTWPSRSTRSRSYMPIPHVFMER